ncbi:hypothetical protein Tco_1309968 [Tanacetum coccineum]
MIMAGPDNRPPMLEKSMYNSWQNHMLIYIKGKEHGRMMLNFVLNGPLVYGTIEVDGVTRLKTFEELTDAEKLQDDCDVRATNIILQGLPLEVFTLVKGELLHEYYLWFAQLMNDMHTIGMTMQQCTQPKRPRNSAWFKKKILRIQAQEAGQELDEEQLAFLTDDLNTFDSDCDEAPGAKAVLMANLSSYDSTAIFEIKPTLYDGDVISRKHDVISVVDFEETLTLAEDKQAFWLLVSNPISEQLVVPPTPIKIEVPSELPKKELLLENDRLLKVIISQDLVHTAINSLEVIDEFESMRKSWCEEYNRNLTLETELSKMNEISKTCSRLQNHCISLELKLEQYKESFHNNRSCRNLDAPALNEFFCNKRSESLVTTQGILDKQVESTHCNIKRKKCV